jgi:hypothetical protein
MCAGVLQGLEAPGQKQKTGKVFMSRCFERLQIK